MLSAVPLGAHLFVRTTTLWGRTVFALFCFTLTTCVLTACVGVARRVPAVWAYPWVPYEPIAAARTSADILIMTILPVVRPHALPDNRAARLAAAEAALTKALSVAPEHALAHLYLGFVQSQPCAPRH